MTGPAWRQPSHRPDPPARVIADHIVGANMALSRALRWPADALADAERAELAAHLARLRATLAALADVLDGAGP